MQDRWDRAEPEGKGILFGKVVQQYRAGAKAQLMKEYPELKDAIKMQATAKMKALNPTGQ
jgi:hypothetical protein